MSRLAELVGEVESQVRTFVTNRPSRPALEEARVSDRALLDRGVTVRSIGLDSVRSDRRFMAHLAWFRESGAQIRTTPTLPLRLLIFDDDVALLAQDPADPSVGAVVLHGKGLIAAVSALFDLHWERGVDPFGEAAARPSPLTPSERGLIKMLAQGHKDEACARNLDVSVRTVRRMVADLTERVGAGSRFELAILAARGGWI